MEDPSNPQIQGELQEVADKDTFSLIDGSTLDDLFVSMSEPRFVDNKATVVDKGVSLMEIPEPPMPKKNEKYNLRKSLAWDSAFFTSAGVLDAEELSSIMEVGNCGKQQMQRMPGIQEDICKSTDSLSTLESDNLSLESLEADLFSDIRASIQRSGESSKLRRSNLNGRPEDTIQLGKNAAEIKLGNMVKPKPTPKKLITNVQDGKPMKLGPSREQVRKPVGSRREPSVSLLKPAAASGKGSSMVMAPAKVPTKRMSISAGRIKADTNNVGNETGRVTNMSKGDRPGVSRSIIPKAAYAKSSSSSSTTIRTGISSTRSSIDSTGSSKSESSRILPLNGLQGKTNRPASIPPPVVKSKIPSRVPSRVTLKGKNPPSSTRISAKLSASLLSPSVSPTSSTSEWSSSSSTVNANQDHSVSKDCSTLHRSFSLDSIASQDLQIHPNQQASRESKIEVVGVPGIAEELPPHKAPVPNPVSAKPTGLRMPSPKIGFFDGVKAGGRTQNAVGSMQSRSRLSSSRLPKSTTGTSSPGGVPNKGRIGQAAVKANASTPTNANPDSQRSNARMNATGGGRMEGISTAPKDSNVRASEDVSKTALLKTNGVKKYAAAKSPVGEKHNSECGSSSREKSELVSASKNGNPEGKPQFQDDQASSAVEADPQIMKMDDDSKVLHPHLLHKSINEDKVDAELHQEGKSHFQDNQVSSALEADHQFMETDDDSKVLNPDLLHELINGNKVDTELHPIIVSEEVSSAIKADGNADTVVVNAGLETTTTGKNDSKCVVISNQQNVFAQEEVNELIAYVDIVGNEIEPHSNINSVSDTHSEAISSTSELSGLNQNSEVADLPKQTDLCVSSKILESNSGSGPSLAEKNSSADAYAMERHPINMSEDVANAIEVDENADTLAVNGGYEATTEKIDLKHAVITDQHNASAEQQVNEIADNVVVNGGCEATMEKIDLKYAVISDQHIAFSEEQTNEFIGNVGASESLSPPVSCNVELTGLSQKKDETNLPKQADLCALESNPGSRTPLSDRRASELVSPSKNGTSERKSHLQDKEVTSVVEVDHQIMEIDDSKVLHPENVVSEVHPINTPEEVGNAITVTENADTVVANGGYEATVEVVEGSCVEMEGKEEVADLPKKTDLCVSSRTSLDDNYTLSDAYAMEVLEKSFTSLNVNSVSDSPSPALSCTVELSGMSQKEASTDICVFSKLPDCIPGSRTPLAEKNSSPDAYNMEVLLKSFTSLSLENVQANDV